MLPHLLEHPRTFISEADWNVIEKTHHATLLDFLILLAHTRHAFRELHFAQLILWRLMGSTSKGKNY
jgi:hypothetical protein